MTTQTITVGITLSESDAVTTTLTPRKIPVPNGQVTVLEWTIPEGQGSFHETNPFTWNTSPTIPAPPVVSRVSNTKLQSEPYTNTVNGGVSLTWRYTVRVVNGTAAVTMDPEVDNQPPG